MDNTFPKKERLTSKKEIQSLFESGSTGFVFPIKYFYNIENEENTAPVRVLISVPKRNFKQAVKRNRIKRLIREAYRLNKTLIVQSALEHKLKVNIAFVFIDKQLPTFQRVQSAMQKLLRQIAKEAEKFEK